MQKSCTSQGEPTLLTLIIQNDSMARSHKTLSTQPGEPGRGEAQEQGAAGTGCSSHGENWCGGGLGRLLGGLRALPAPAAGVSHSPTAGLPWAFS